jgi:hypothetical protein
MGELLAAGLQALDDPAQVAARVAGGVAAHASKAARAARTACRASVAAPSGIRPSTASVAESITSMVPAPAGLPCAVDVELIVDFHRFLSPGKRPF